MGCNKVARDIWTWCIPRNLWVSDISLPGKEMLMHTRNLEHLMRTLNGLSVKIFFITLLLSMASHQLSILHLESIKRYPVMCHGSQIPKLNLLMHFLTPGLKNNFMPSLLLAWYFVAFRKSKGTLGKGSWFFHAGKANLGFRSCCTRWWTRPDCYQWQRILRLPSKQAQTPASHGEKLKLIAWKLSGNSSQSKEGHGDWASFIHRPKTMCCDHTSWVFY